MPRCAFFEQNFDYRLLVDKGADTFFGLVDGGLVLIISNFYHVEEVQYPRLFHVGFTLESDNAVNAVCERMAADWLRPGKPKHFHGAWILNVQVSGGGMVEVSHHDPGFD